MTKKNLLSIIACAIILVIGYKIGVTRSMSPYSISYYITLIGKKIKGECFTYDYEDFDLPEISIHINKTGKGYLDSLLFDCVTNKNGWLSSELISNDYVKAKVSFNKKEFPIKVRLKGNTGNSLNLNYSLRVKSKTPIIDGIKSFNFQPVSVKSYENEWFFHSLANEMGLFKLDYFFCKANINSKTDLYAIEEHFHSNLVSKNKLDPGIIICFEESVETLNYAHNQIASGKLGRASFFIAKIKPYYKKEVLKNDSLYSYYIKARNKLESFRRGELITSKVFDIQKLAKLFTLSDLLGEIHPLEYRNIKFYYNSKTNLLEPIPYDLNSGMKDLTTSSESRNIDIVGSIGSEFDWINIALSDSIFFHEYMQTLSYYSTKNISEKFINTFNQIDSIQRIMRIKPITDYYQVDYRKAIQNNQNFILRKLNPFKLANCFLKNGNEDYSILTIENIHDLPIKVISVELKSGEIIPIKRVISASITGHKVNYCDIKVLTNSKQIKNINLCIIGLNKIYKENLLPY